MKGQQISSYRLTEKLGEGTYGEVWKGVHVHDESFTVAVKLVSQQVRSDPSFVTALKRECRALDRLEHTSIVRFRELVIQDGAVAMVLELLEGRDLEAVLAQGPQPVDEVVRILEKSLAGLAYAHGRGVVHRDLKPGNIYRCDDGRVKLMDFGIARAADGTQATQTGTLKGTLDYMAPERFSQGGGGPASDVYAMGLVAWELLAGRRACQGADLPQKLGWHLGVGLTDVRTVRPDCPAWLAGVVAALGHKDAAARPADGAAAAALLAAARSGAGPVAAGAAAVSSAPSPAPAAPPTPSAPSTVTVDRTSLPPVAARSTPPSGPPSGAPSTVAVDRASLPPVAAPAPSPEPVPASAPEPAPAPAPEPAPAPAEAQTPAPPPSAPSPTPSRSLPRLALAVAGLGGVLVLGVFGSDWLEARRAESLRSERKRLKQTGQDSARAADGARTGITSWVSIPGGTFQMGSTSGAGKEQPVHAVTVPSFELMKTEVTVGQYRRCVESGSCTAPDDRSANESCNWGHPDRDDHPVNCVDWEQAVAFAAWAGGRLPTEAEWEYAARSGGRSQAYPWGDAEATCDRAVMDDGGDGCGLEHTAEVCSRPAGNSTQGVCDLAGNVWEWVQDGWHDTYRGAPGDGSAWEDGASGRVLRGGSWNGTASHLRASYRYGYVPSSRDDYLGFRLARSSP